MKVSQFHLLKNDQQTVDVMKVLSKIWECRSDEAIVTDLATILCQFVDEKRVFADLEFFLPQLAHLTIHLDHHKRNEAMEMLLALISQTSLQAAFKLSLHFSTCLQDFQAELPNGEANPTANSFLFCKCARLLEDVERAVIYGSQIVSLPEKREIEKCITEKSGNGNQRNSRELAAAAAAVQTPALPPLQKSGAQPLCQQILSQACISPSSITTTPTDEGTTTSSSGEQPTKTLKEFKKMEVARRISRTDSFQFHIPELSGELYYKRCHRKSIFHTKQWKTRYFVIDKKILVCFKDPFAVNPIRSIDLRYAHVVDLEPTAKYGNTEFEIVDDATGATFLLRAETETEKKSWMNVLANQIDGACPVIVSDSKRIGAGSSEPPGIKAEQIFVEAVRFKDMSSTQKKRYSYFRQMHMFVINLVNISARLGESEQSLRKFFLPHDMNELEIPPFAYHPLANSLESYGLLLKPLPKECSVLSNLYSNCPTLMFFEMEMHPQQSDNAEFLGTELDRYSENTIINKDMRIIRSFTGCINDLNGPGGAEGKEQNPHDLGSSHGNSEKQVKQGHISTRFAGFMKGQDYWSAEGTGFLRAKEIGLPLAMHKVSSSPSLHSSSHDEGSLPGIPEDSVMTTTTTSITTTTHPSSSSSMMEPSKRLDFSSSHNTPHDPVTLLPHQMHPPLPLPRSRNSSGASDSTYVLEFPNNSQSNLSTSGTTHYSSAAASNVPLGIETFENKTKRLRLFSSYGQLPAWKLDGFIATSNNDLRQEAFTIQMLNYYREKLVAANIPVWLHPSRILPTSKNGGIKEYIANAVSIDELKKKSDFPASLRLWFEKIFQYRQPGMSGDNSRFHQAMEAFVASMAGYSIVTYLLSIKDRHHGNMLIDHEGHIIHINFGQYSLGLSPHLQPTIEGSPWKLSKEMIDVMGGPQSSYFQQYKQRCAQAFILLRKHAQEAMQLMEIMNFNANLPAFKTCSASVKEFELRYYLDLPDSKIPEMVDTLLHKSMNNYSDELYDTYQQAKNGIVK